MLINNCSPNVIDITVPIKDHAYTLDIAILYYILNAMLNTNNVFCTPLVPKSFIAIIQKR